MANNTIHPNTIEMVKCAAHGVPFSVINYHNFVDKFKLESKWNSRNKVGDTKQNTGRGEKKNGTQILAFPLLYPPFLHFLYLETDFFSLATIAVNGQIYTLIAAHCIFTQNQNTYINGNFLTKMPHSPFYVYTYGLTTVAAVCESISTIAKRLGMKTYDFFSSS